MGGEVDIPTVVSDEYVVVSATRFHGQLTSEVGSRGIVARNSTAVRIKGGQSKEVGSRESQSEGVEERREASAREGWRGGVLEERRFCLTTSRWPRAMNSDWGGFRRSSLVVRPRIVMYPRRIA